jgi:malate synthase
MVSTAMEVFDEIMLGANQIDRKREDVQVTAEDLLEVPQGAITEKGLRTNISVGIQYTEAWLRGRGAVPINNLMEDAATAEISRAQAWQWLHHDGKLDDGREITEELFKTLLVDELEKIKDTIGEELYQSGKFDIASELFETLTLNREFEDFLTLPGYERLN